jgi:hypothetical protein
MGGGVGNDDFNGDGSGNDGLDTVTYGTPYTATGNLNITIAGTVFGVNNDTDNFGGSDDVLGDIERIIGNGGNDIINATGYIPIPASGTEVGQLGVQLFGRLGNDTLTDSPGDDFLNGEGGTDTINCPNGGTDVALNEEAGGAGCES